MEHSQFVHKWQYYRKQLVVVDCRESAPEQEREQEYHLGGMSKYIYSHS